MNVDRSEFLDEAGDVLPISEIPTEAKRILDLDFVTDRHGTQRAVYRLPRRMDAIAELARIMGLVKNPVTISTEGSDATGIKLIQPSYGQPGCGPDVHFYIPENGRDPIDLEQDRLNELRKRFDQFKQEKNDEVRNKYIKLQQHHNDLAG